MFNVVVCGVRTTYDSVIFYFAAKVNPVRQQQPASVPSYLPPRPSIPTTTHDHLRTEASSHPTSYTTPTPAHSIPHSQVPSTGMFLSQPHRPMTSAMTLPGSVTAIDARSDRYNINLFFFFCNLFIFEEGINM